MRILPDLSVKETPQLCRAKKSFTVEVIALGGSVGEIVKFRDREELLSLNLTFLDWFTVGAMNELYLGEENVVEEGEGVDSCANESAFIFEGNVLVSVSRVRISITRYNNTSTISPQSYTMSRTYVVQPFRQTFVDVIVVSAIHQRAQPTLC